MSGTPNVMLDGTINYIGGTGSGSMYSTYLPSVVSRQSQASPLQLSGTYTVLENTINLVVDVTVDATVTTTGNVVHVIVAREGYHGQSNLAVDLLTAEPLTVTTPGQTASFQRDFTIDPAWNNEDLRIILVAQSQDSKEILQGAMAVPDFAGVITVDCEPDGIQAAWVLEDSEGHSYTGQGDKTLGVFLTGDYTMTWQDVPLWTSPGAGSQLQTLAEGGQLDFSGVYTDGPFATVVSTGMAGTTASTGAALVDFDNDGDLDIHVLNADGPDMLLANSGSGYSYLNDVATGLLADAGHGTQAAWADVNHDGNQDVYLARIGAPNLLLLGDGMGGFTQASTFGAAVEGDATGACWVDYNLDGNLDLYVCQTGGANALLTGYGEMSPGLFVFNDAGGASAVAGNSMAATWTDGNLDGRLDLYVLNAYSANVMLANSPIGFDNITNSTGLGDVSNSTGAAWGDLDNDGDLDLYMTNDGMADRLYECNGEFLYTLLPADDVSDPGNGRGVLMVDLDGDMFLDIYVVRHDQPDLLLMNNGDLSFTPAPVGAAEVEGPGNTVVCGDLDRDGGVDLFITRDGASDVLLRNTMAGDNHWFRVNLTGSANQPDAIGARVVLTAGGVSQTRLVLPSTGYQSTSSRELNFGLGPNQQVDQVHVFWPDGTEQVAGPFPKNLNLSIIQGEDPVSAVNDQDGHGDLPAADFLGRAYPNPFNPSTTIQFALARGGATRLEVFDLDGSLVRCLVNQTLPAGQHTATWQGRDQQGRAVASGAYFYRLTTADGRTQAGRMVLIK